MKLDKTDNDILSYLQKDSKIAIKQLSVYLNLSNTAIYERIKKLEKNGVIEKYVAIVNKEKIDS